MPSWGWVIIILSPWYHSVHLGLDTLESLCAEDEVDIHLCLTDFYWSISDLQYYVSFYSTSKWIRYTYILTHSFLDSIPIQQGLPVAQLVKNPPALWESWDWPLGWEDPLEKGKATQSSILAWRIQTWTIQSMRSRRVGHDWATFTSLGLPWWLRRKRVYQKYGRPGFDPWVGKIPWRRKWQPTAVLLPGKIPGWRSLAGYSPWGRTESDTTEQLHFLSLSLSHTARRPNHSNLKEINPEYSLEGLILKLQYFGHLMWRANSLEKTLIPGKIEGKRRRGWDSWMASPIQWTWTWTNSGRWWGARTPGKPESMGSQRVRHNLATAQHSQIGYYRVLSSIPCAKQLLFNH